MTTYSPIPQIAAIDVPDGAPLLDVREDHEWEQIHVAWAQHIPMAELKARAGDIAVPENGPLIVACHIGGRSAQVTAWLRSQGVDAVNLTGGMDAWEAAGRPVA